MKEAYLSAVSTAIGMENSASNITKLSQQFGEEEARWAFQQIRLREKAKRKFVKADEMFFVAQALEQASHEEVAQYHATLFPSEALVVDLTCAIGGDLVALAKRGPVKGFDLESERVWCASMNLAANSLEGHVEVADSMQIPWDFEYAFADPSRRIGDRRTLSIDEFEPDPVILSQKLRQLKLGVIKLTPMLPDDILESLGDRIEFISHRGECKEALVFCGMSDFEHGRFAVHIESGEVLGENPLSHSLETPLKFVIEPDPALIRIHGLGHLGTYLLGNSRYVVANELEKVRPLHHWCKLYTVLDHGSFDPKHLKQKLKLFGGGQPELKQSGADLDLIQLQKQLKQPGNATTIVIFYKVGLSVRYAIVKKTSF